MSLYSFVAFCGIQTIKEKLGLTFSRKLSYFNEYQYQVTRKRHNARLCETARLAFFFAIPRHFEFLDFETENSYVLSASARRSDS